MRFCNDKGSSNLLKRKAASTTDAEQPVLKGAKFSSEDILPNEMKKRRSKPESNVDILERKQEGEFTGDKNDDEEEDDDGDDQIDEAVYLLGDEGPADSEDEEILKLLPNQDADEADDDENKPRKFSHGYHLVQGKMNHGMEDNIFAKHKNVNGYDLGLYAIFDGHSGRDVAKCLQEHLFENILSEPDFWKNPVRVVKEEFRATDDEILEQIADSRGGSTAVAAILINGVKLLAANVGDSRAILCRNGHAKQITVDHDPLKEKDLVESRGGFVSKRPGNIPRVDGQLSMTRAFGDGKLKEHITAEPDVMVQKIDEDTDFIILASDGLWKVMTNQEACDCIRGTDDAQKASKKLIKEALSHGSCDDISCIVVMF